MFHELFLLYSSLNLSTFPCDFFFDSFKSVGLKCIVQFSQFCNYSFLIFDFDFYFILLQTEKIIYSISIFLNLLRLVLWPHIWSIPPNMVCNIWVIMLLHKLSVNGSLRNQKLFGLTSLPMLPHSLSGKKSHDSSDKHIFANIGRRVIECLIGRNNTKEYSVVSCFLTSGKKENGAVGLYLEDFFKSICY